MSLTESRSPHPAADAITWHSQIASAFDERYHQSPVFRDRLRVWTRLIERYSKFDGTTVDAGCGTGALSEIAARHAGSLFAFDPSERMLSIASRKFCQQRNINLRRMSIAQLSRLTPLSADLVICSSVLEYLDKPLDAIETLKGHLKPSGTLIFSVPNRTSLYRRAERFAFYAFKRPRYLAFTNNRLGAIHLPTHLRRLGFDVVEQPLMGGIPILSSITRPFGLARFTDTLVAFVCRKQEAVDLENPNAI
ncbi:MAG: class I SAM-dependent methyltransferase [Pseudomonadota bacterium]